MKESISKETYPQPCYNYICVIRVYNQGELEKEEFILEEGVEKRKTMGENPRLYDRISAYVCKVENESSAIYILFMNTYICNYSIKIYMRKQNTNSGQRLFMGIIDGWLDGWLKDGQIIQMDYLKIHM